MNCAGCADCPFISGAVVEEGLHEIHITIETSELETFKQLMRQHGVKVILIDNGTSAMQPMTSVRFRGTDSACLAESNRLSELLETAGLRVTRIKIECAPTGPRDWSKGYFESHLAFKIHSHQRTALGRVLARVAPEARLSSNDFKREENGVSTVMSTIRARSTTPEDFGLRMRDIQSKLTRECWNSDRLIVEFCWHDTNEIMDREWLK